MPIDNIFDNMETVAASVIIVNTVTGKYRVLKKHWSFSNDYTDGIAWNDSVQAFKEHELLPDQENRDLVDNMRTENLVTALRDAETYISVDVQKKDTVWCRLRAVPSETDEEGNILSGKYGLDIPNAAYFFDEGLVCVENEDSLWGFLDEDGREVIPCQWDDPAWFYGGLAEVQKDGKMAYIDREGKVVWQGKVSRY